MLLPWPASPAIKAQLTLLLQAHPGRSLAVTLAVPQRPSIAWQDGPDALGFTASPISWEYARPLAAAAAVHILFRQFALSAYSLNYV